MQHYDDIVVGSGISGLTLSLLLGLNGRSVLLLEKAPAVGGSLARFYRSGVPLDTGFHFTGGFVDGGIMSQMLQVLGIREAIKPLRLLRECDNRFVLECNQARYDMPAEYSALVARMKDYFPSERSAIDEYFRRVREVCENTVSMSLRSVTELSRPIEEDFISLGAVLAELTENAPLKALLSGYSLCYGVRPSEVSFANHSRVCHGLYQSIVRVQDGGGAFIRAFVDAFRSLPIEVRCGTHIVRCEDVVERRVGRFVLSSGEEVSAEHCTFTIHPKQILDLLPEGSVRGSFYERVGEFEPSIGFFSVYATVEPGEKVEAFRPAIISLLPSDDMEMMYDGVVGSDMPLVLMKSHETVGDRNWNVLNAFEVSLPSHVAKWVKTRSGARPSDYQEYKAGRVTRIQERIFAEFPEYEGGFRFLDAASMLTFRDYLHSPDGCAYGVKQKMGQLNVIGRLPLRNLYAAGQSAILPGVVGAMMSSFVVGRLLIGRDAYGRFLGERLDAI